MAKIVLSNGTDPRQVAAQLKRIGITMRQHLPDGSYVVYVSKPFLFEQFLQNQTDL